MTSRNVRTSFGPRSGAAVLAVAGTLLMAGCSGGAPADPGTGSPTPSQSASPSVPPTPTPTPSAVYKPADASGPAQNVPVPVLPEVAKTETKEGAEAFTKYWFEVSATRIETGDIVQPAADQSPSVISVDQVTRHVTTNWHGGRWLAGGKIDYAGRLQQPSSERPMATIKCLASTHKIRSLLQCRWQTRTSASNRSQRMGTCPWSTFAGADWARQ